MYAGTVPGDNEKARIAALVARNPFYRLGVNINNWVEDRFMLDEKEKLLFEKMNRGELLTQLTRELIQNLCKPVPLTTGYTCITYGAIIQIKAPDMPNQYAPGPNGYESFGLYLNGVVSVYEIQRKTRHLKARCGLSLTGNSTPIVKNTFMLWHMSNCPTAGVPVIYNDPFYIRLAQTEDNIPLYLKCTIPLLDDVRGPNDHYLLELTETPDRYCWFKAVHFQRNKRIETQGSPVPAKQKLVILHIASGQNLAVEFSKWFVTVFGTECGVSVHTYRDIHKRETADNIWMFISP